MTFSFLKVRRNEDVEKYFSSHMRCISGGYKKLNLARFIQDILELL